MAPVNNIERRAAKQLAASDGINYTEALRRIRNSGTKPSSILAGQPVLVSGSMVGVSFVDRIAAKLTEMGGFILKDNEFDLKGLLKKLIESDVHASLNSNIHKVLTEGSATGNAKAANALIRVLAEWELELVRNPDVDMKTVAQKANGTIVSSWSLGNLLEEIDTSVPLNGTMIDLSAEQDWTELSSRVEGAGAVVPDFGNAEDYSIRQRARGMAALGLASLPNVEKSGWFMVRSGWQTKVSKARKQEIKEHGREFVLWSGSADDVETIIRTAGDHNTLDPKVLKPLVEAAKA